MSGGSPGTLATESRCPLRFVSISRRNIGDFTTTRWNRNSNLHLTTDFLGTKEKKCTLTTVLDDLVDAQGRRVGKLLLAEWEAAYKLALLDRSSGSTNTKRSLKFSWRTPIQKNTT